MRKIVILFVLFCGLFLYAADDYYTNNPMFRIVNPDDGNWLRWSDTYLAYVNGDIDSMTVYGDVDIVGGDLTVNGDVIADSDGDSWNMTINSDDHAIFENATQYDFDAKVEVTGEMSASNVTNKSLQSETLGNGVTTFALTSNVVQLTGDAGTNTIATITGAGVGLYTIIFNDGNVTITDTDGHTSNTVDLVGTATDLTGADDTVLQLVYDGTSFYEVSRSAN